MKLGLLLPTYYDSSKFERVIDSFQSMKHLNNVNGLEYEVLINFQNYPMHHQDLLVDILINDEVNHSYVERVPNYTNRTIRNPCFELGKDSCHAFLCVDDDFIYNLEGIIEYFTGLNLLKVDDSLGVIKFTNSKYDSKFSYAPDNEYLYTGNGLMIRNVGRIFSESQLDMKFGFEDLAIACNVLSEGLSVARFSSTKVTNQLVQLVDLEVGSESKFEDNGKWRDPSNYEILFDYCKRFDIKWDGLKFDENVVREIARKSIELGRMMKEI